MLYRIYISNVIGNIYSVNTSPSILSLHCHNLCSDTSKETHYGKNKVLILPAQERRNKNQNATNMERQINTVQVWLLQMKTGTHPIS